MRMTVKQLFKLRRQIENTGVIRADVYDEGNGRPSQPIAWARGTDGVLHELCLWNPEWYKDGSQERQNSETLKQLLEKMGAI